MICDYYAKFQTFLKQKGVQDTVTLKLKNQNCPQKVKRQKKRRKEKICIYRAPYRAPMELKTSVIFVYSELCYT